MVCHWVPFERIHITVVLFEDFDESPIFDIRLLVGGKDKNLSTEGANGNKAAVWAPCEALNTRKDAVGSRRGLRFLVHHD